MSSEFLDARRLADRARRKADREFGPLAQSFALAMQIGDAQRAEGVPLAERLEGLEKTLRAAWPQIRPWRYLCERCNDTGWVPLTCTQNAPCGRPYRLQGQRGEDNTGQGQCGNGHEYVQPCWCVKGQARRDQLERRPKREDFTAAGATTKKPTRIGR